MAQQEETALFKSALSKELLDIMVTKNTFLHWPSPWMDAAHRRDFEAAEASRPSSDPTSSSSRSSSMSSLFSESSGCRASKDKPVKPDQQIPASCGPAKSSVRSATHVWSVGAEGHQEGRCTPCLNFMNGKCKHGYECIRCHMHEKGHRQKKKRMRPPPRLRLAKQQTQAVVEVESEGMGRGDAEEMQQELQEQAEMMFVRANQDGDAFNIVTAEYIPTFVKDNKQLRESFLKRFAEYRQIERASQHACARGPCESRAATPNHSRKVMPQQASADGHSSDDTFSL